MPETVEFLNVNIIQYQAKRVKFLEVPYFRMEFTSFITYQRYNSVVTLTFCGVIKWIVQIHKEIIIYPANVI